MHMYVHSPALVLQCIGLRWCDDLVCVTRMKKNPQFMLHVCVCVRRADVAQLPGLCPVGMLLIPPPLLGVTASDL